jgi:uncharacterized protein YggU (UPF0235/DUF167 family)
MIYRVRVQPGSSLEKVVKNPDGNLKVYLRVPPIGGRANEALREVLADEFGVAKSRVSIIRGQNRREKVVEVC